VGIGEVRGAVQLSYQRALSFDGQRSIQQTGLTTSGEIAISVDDASSDGGFDVVAFGTGLRLSRHVRAGVTVNRWLGGYRQDLTRIFVTPNQRPRRDFDLDFRPRGWSFNFGLIWSPIDTVNVAAIYKTPFSADVRLDKARQDYWGAQSLEEVTTNTHSSDTVLLEFPSSYGFGVSWRPRDTLTLSADFTRTTWSEARILDYFEVDVTGRSAADGTPATPPPPKEFQRLQYPTRFPVPESTDPEDPLRLLGQQDAEQIRAGIEWVLIKGPLKIPLRAGYFNDRQITPNPTGDIPRFNGLTAGMGFILGSMMLDVAYVYEFGEYFITSKTASGGEFDEPVATTVPVRNSLKTRRFFASVIYRFSGRP
jgi:long-subunit fatty acid transport protein